jgi:hypothetical protein
MPKPIKFIYAKKEPFRDSYYFIIVCEGKNREPDYFRFFDGLSSRVKIVAVESVQGNSAPLKLIENAINKEKELDANPEIDHVWFVIDTDSWRQQIHELRQESELHTNWQIAQSNPCFEVWLYFHAKNNLPPIIQMDRCSKWKPYLHKIIRGGFNPDRHPIAIETAINNAKAIYEADGYTPRVGNTQVWILGEELLPLIKNELNAIKPSFPIPEVIS